MPEIWLEFTPLIRATKITRTSSGPERSQASFACLHDLILFLLERWSIYARSCRVVGTTHSHVCYSDCATWHRSEQDFGSLPFRCGGASDCHGTGGRIKRGTRSPWLQRPWHAQGIQGGDQRQPQPVLQNIKKYDEWLDRTVTEPLTVSNTEENLLDFNDNDTPKGFKEESKEIDLIDGVMLQPNLIGKEVNTADADFCCDLLEKDHLAIVSCRHFKSSNDNTLGQVLLEMSGTSEQVLNELKQNTRSNLSSHLSSTWIIRRKSRSVTRPRPAPRKSS